MKKTHWWLLSGAILLLLCGGAFLALRVTAPINVALHYPLPALAEEARVMVECAACHETTEFHSCETCHDDHGAVELAGVPFYAVVAFQGDVPEAGYVYINDIIPYTEQPNTHIKLLDFLAEQEASDFESVTLASNDGGFVTIAKEDLNENALLMPFEDGIRFASEDLHVSTWIKGITRIIVVGAAKPLSIEGQATSIGRLLLEPTYAVTLEQTNVMLKSENDGQIRQAKTASRIEGIPLAAHLTPGFTTLTVTTANGEDVTLSASESQGAVLAQLRGVLTLVRPDRGRSEWVSDVTALSTE